MRTKVIAVSTEDDEIMHQTICITPAELIDIALKVGEDIANVPEIEDKTTLVILCTSVAVSIATQLIEKHDRRSMA